MLDLKSIIQAMLLANNGAMMPLAVLKSVLVEFSAEQILKAIKDINDDQAQVYSVCEISGMYYLKVKSTFNSYLSRLHQQAQHTEYSKTFAETVAALAMYQPITKKQLEDKLGKTINDQIFYQLQDRQWVKITYAKFDQQEYFSTTKEFLQYFNLSSVFELEKKLNAILLDSNLQVIW